MALSDIGYKKHGEVSKDMNFQHSLPSLVLLGQLLNNIPALVDVIIQTQGPLMTYLISCLDASEEKIKVAAVFALLKVLGSRDQQIPIPMHGQLANRMMGLLSGADGKELQQNSMELLRKLLENGDVVRGLMQQSRTGLPSALKKMLMSRDTTLKVTSMQCVHHILSQDKQDQEITHYSDDLLDADIAEFLFEALATTDGNLLSCTFGCLLLFTDCQSFFTKCHTVYGIESIIRALHHSVKLNNVEALHQGLKVLSEILKRQPEDVHLLNGLGIHKQINSLIEMCLKHSDTGIQIQTGCALKHLLRKHHLPKPIDYIALISLLQSMQDCMEKLPRPISENTSRHHRHQRKSVKDGITDTGGACSKEKLLLCGFDVFEQAFGLVNLLLTVPSPESHLVLMSSDKNTLTNLQYFLLRFLDSTCIPIFMVNYADLSNPAGFASFFHMLCMAFTFNIDLKDFAQKLESLPSLLHVILLIHS
ncbi:meiosis inhibitor protein 1-like [Amphiura filiformis]|uniref:meiosis inhibitor protein 1-like n=1 Tax=Amphiura filiformis TaxID=82378 RepID=UPI003B216909